MLLRIWGQQKNVHDELYAMFILIETFTDSSSVMDLHKNKKFKETLSFACSHSCWLDTTVLILFRLGFFGAAHGCPPLPKICHTYSTIMNLGTVILHLKKFQKDYESHEIPLEFCWHFFTGNQQILLYQEIQI